MNIWIGGCIVAAPVALVACVGWALTARTVRQLRRLVALTEVEGEERAEARHLDGLQRGIVEGHRQGRAVERRRLKVVLQRMLRTCPERGHRRAAIEETIQAIGEVPDVG